MSTTAQIAANRANAQRSTGPRTDAGKAKVRQNALRHGLCSGIPSMDDETVEEVQILLDTLREEHEPVGATEEILVYKMAEHFFFGKRASYLLSEQLDWADKGDENHPLIALMLRYHTTADHGYHRALKELRKVQSERRLLEIGSVSQDAPDAEPSVPAPVSQPPVPAQTEAQTTTPTGRSVEKAAPTAGTAPKPLAYPPNDPEQEEIARESTKEAA